MTSERNVSRRSCKAILHIVILNTCNTMSIIKMQPLLKNLKRIQDLFYSREVFSTLLQTSSANKHSVVTFSKNRFICKKCSIPAT